MFEPQICIKNSTGFGKDTEVYFEGAKVRGVQSIEISPLNNNTLVTAVIRITGVTLSQEQVCQDNGKPSRK